MLSEPPKTVFPFSLLVLSSMHVKEQLRNKKMGKSRKQEERYHKLLFMFKVIPTTMVHCYNDKYILSFKKQ